MDTSERTKDVLTTGDVARICRVAPRTVSKWVDSGQLRGYRIPGSRDRRIPLPQLVRFMRAHGIPLNGMETGLTRLLIVDADSDLTGALKKTLTETGFYEVRVAESAFEAGAITEAFRPNLLLVAVDLPGLEGRTLTRYIASHAELTGTQTVAVSHAMTPADRQSLLQQGFDNTLARPFDLRDLIRVIDETLSVLH